MNVQINETLRNDYGSYITATCDKTKATVGITKHYVQVCCHNAANKVWRGPGRHFETTTDALAGYKSGEMKAIINAAITAAAEVTQ